MDVDDDVIPSRNARLLLVNGRGDVGVRAMEDGQDLTAGGKICVLRVGPRQVTSQDTPLCVEQEWQVANRKAAFTLANNSGERVRADVSEQRLTVIEPENLG